MEDTAGDYVLHPSLMEGALRAAVGLIEAGSEFSLARFPFALDLLRILSRCTPEMAVWVRYSPDHRTGNDAAKLDVDLCDERGNVCIQMRGLASRVPSGEISRAAAPPQAIGGLLATPAWQESASRHL